MCGRDVGIDSSMRTHKHFLILPGLTRTHWQLVCKECFGCDLQEVGLAEGESWCPPQVRHAAEPPGALTRLSPHDLKGPRELAAAVTEGKAGADFCAVRPHGRPAGA